MTLDELKLFNVRFDNGSGCMFQPISNNDTYILTAKHLFEGTAPDENGDLIDYSIGNGTAISIFRTIESAGTWEETKIQFVLQRGETYFAHKDADAVILKLPYISGFDKIFTSEIREQATGYKLYGYPVRFEGRAAGNKDTGYEIKSLITPVNYGYTAQLFSTTLNKDEIQGMSGGGIIRTVDGYISLIGIQSEMKAADYATGQINFVPIRYFDEIVTANEGKLSPLYPPYFGSFRFLEKEVFGIKPGLLTQKKCEKLTNILKAKAKEINESDLTPLYIKDFLKEKYPSFYKQESNEISRKKIWSVWLELLTIINIAKGVKLSKADFPHILKKVRLFYSNVEDDFWVKHLHDLPKMDYSGLDEGGSVMVASNIEAKDNLHIYDFRKVPEDISRVNTLKEQFDLGRIGQKTDEGSDFPLYKYRFMNVSAFKEGTINDLEETFTVNDIENCLNTLKELYGKLIPNW